jgi:mono/diheme cytochrome c family protein
MKFTAWGIGFCNIFESENGHVRSFACTLALLCLLSGCQKPEFAHRAEFHELEDFAQEYAEDVLNAYYGTPTQMVAWNRLPLKQHLGQATVQSAKTENGHTTLVLDVGDSHRDFPPGTELLWSEGNLNGQPSGWLGSWNEITSTATLDSELKTLPEEGSKLILGPGQILVEGRHLYAEHCQHCHGVAGDGAGPTARYLNPLPRDYRKGIFKFTLTQASERACRDDLVRVIELGVPGTYMPSFKLMSPDEMESLVEYVLWLSMRGETEYQMVRLLADSYSRKAVAERIATGLEAKANGEEDFETRESIQKEFYELVNDPDEFPYELNSMIQLMANRWKGAQLPTALVVPQQKWAEPDAASVERGRKLYLSPDLNCAACHGEAGFGDGPQTYAVTKDLETGQDNPSPGLYDSWGHPIAPRNLHAGIFRGGRRPIDVYARLHAGIKGTPMPAFGGKLKDQDLWDLVNFLYSVPFEKAAAGNGEPTPASQPAEKEMAAHVNAARPQN